MREIYLVAATFVEGTPDGPEAAARSALLAAFAATGAPAHALGDLRLGASGPMPPDAATRLALAAELRPAVATTMAGPGAADALMSLCEAISGGWCAFGVAVGVQAAQHEGGRALGLPDPATPSGDAVADSLAWRLAPTSLPEASALLAQLHPHAPEAEAWARAIAGPDAAPEALTAMATARTGASACVLASAEAVSEYKLTPLARIVSLGRAGADPALWPLGAAQAAQLALHRMGFAPSDLRAAALDAPSLAALVGVAAALGLPPHRAAAGAGALGAAPGGPAVHLGAADPIARIAPLLAALERVDGRFGLLAAAQPAGQGSAFVLDREFYV